MRQKEREKRNNKRKKERGMKNWSNNDRKKTREMRSCDSKGRRKIKGDMNKNRPEKKKKGCKWRRRQRKEKP
jgi:hypothetical protein